ncbi:proline-rich protein 36-like [Takifugu flavidus]|nr:proline-rich protein 36-like [Takifugu flavidus]
MARNGGGRVLYVALLFIVAGSCGRLENLKSEEDSKENLKVDQEQVADHHTHHGRLVIGQNSFTFKGSKRRRLPAADAGYQADMRWMQPPQRGPKLFQQRPNDVTMEQIMKMEPKVECLAGSMKLEVQNSPATSGSLFLIDRGSQLSPVPISKLPSSCGYTTKSTRRDLVMVAPYDGCFVNQEEDNYVLSMLWLGVPVKMLCPQVRPCLSNPPMVACYAEGMVVKMDWPLSDIKVNVSGDWERLMTASQRCGFGIVEHSEGVVVSVDYRFCLQKKDGMYKLELFGDGKSIISCPLMSEGQPEWTGEIFSLPEQKPGTPQGPGYPMVYPTYPPWPEPKPAVQKPGTPQGPGYPMVYPTYPPWPEPKPAVQKPGTPQGPGYPMVYPTYPPWPEQKPAIQKPGTPQGPGYPMVYPTYPPWPEQKPAIQKPGTPQGPGYPMVYPTYPPWPEPKPAVQKPGTPQGPWYPMVYPTYPPCLEQKPGVNPACHLQPGEKPAFQQPEAPSGKVNTSSYSSHPENQPEGGKPVQWPGVWPGQLNPNVYPSYPQHSQKPGMPPSEEYWKPIYYPLYPDQNDKKPTLNPTTWPPTTEKPTQVQKPYLPQSPPGKPVENNGQVSQYLYGYYHPPPVGQNPEEPSVLQPNSGGVVGLQSSLSMPSLYCACPSGFGNCCPQIAFHQHHHHILPVGPGSGAVPPIYTGLPFAPLVAVPVFEGDSRPPAPQKPNEPTLTPDPPTSSPPESEKQLYFQPPDGSLTAILESLSLSPEQAYAYLDPREVSQYWSYSPLSAGQDSGQEPVNPIAQLHPYMLQRPKEQYQSSPGNTNSESVSHFYHQMPQQQEAMRKPKPLSAKPWARYDVLQDAHVPTKNISALPRSPTVNRSNNKRDRQVNASSESNGYILLQHGPPGKVPHRFESPLDLRRPAHLGTDQGHSDKSPEDLKPSNENAEPTRQRKGTHASFPNFWTRTISKRTIRPHALQKASRQWVSPVEQKAKD